MHEWKQEGFDALQSYILTIVRPKKGSKRKTPNRLGSYCLTMSHMVYAMWGSIINIFTWERPRLDDLLAPPM